MSFDEIFDLTAGVYLNFFIIIMEGLVSGLLGRRGQLLTLPCVFIFVQDFVCATFLHCGIPCARLGGEGGGLYTVPCVRPT